MCIYSFVQKKYREVKPETESGYVHWVGGNGMPRMGAQEEDSRRK